MNKISFLKMHPDAKIPARAHASDAGLDLTTVESGTLDPGQGRIFKTGLAVGLNEGTVGLIWDRSSMGKRGIKTLGGVIDSGYRGEIGVVLWNLSGEVQEIESGERIAQLLIQKVETPQAEEVQSFSGTDRGEAGFGSSGK